MKKNVLLVSLVFTAFSVSCISKNKTVDEVETRLLGDAYRELIENGYSNSINEEGFYKKVKSQTLHLHTTVKIGGEDYEIMFMDFDED